jgi:uncharacterized protein (DUF2141 family)
MHLLFFLIFLIAPVQENTLTIHITGVQPGKGNVMVALFTDEQTFLVKPQWSHSKAASTGKMVIRISLPHGNYALSAFQDVNSNGRLDKGWTGIPDEPIAFGNNYRPFGKPAFRKCIIEFSDKSTETAIDLYSIF